MIPVRIGSYRSQESSPRVGLAQRDQKKGCLGPFGGVEKSLLFLYMVCTHNLALLEPLGGQTGAIKGSELEALGCKRLSGTGKAVSLLATPRAQGLRQC